MARTRSALKKRFSRFLKRGARPALNRLLARYSKVGDPVIFDKEIFPWTKILEGHSQEICLEALRLRALRDSLPTFHEVSPYQQRISKGDSWRTLWLYGFGHQSPVAQQLCPVTARLIRQVPQLQTALFSMLAPGTHIPAHRGVYKGLINYHLGLVVPRQAEKCRMQVGDQQIVWQPGQSYVFDDTNTHEVWNDTDEDRIVLFLQFHRPFRLPGPPPQPTLPLGAAIHAVPAEAQTERASVGRALATSGPGAGTALHAGVTAHSDAPASEDHREDHREDHLGGDTMSRSLLTLFTITALSLFATASGCRDEGPAERLGKAMDDKVSDLSEAAEEAVDDAGRAIKRSADDARNAVHDAVDDAMD